MVRLSRIYKDHRVSGAMNALVGVHAAIDESTFLTKGGELLTVLKVEGVDDECLDVAQLEEITRSFETALRGLDENFRIYQYFRKRQGSALPPTGHDDSIVNEILNERTTHLAHQPDPLYSFETHLVIAYGGWHHTSAWKQTFVHLATRPLAALEEMLSTEKKIAVLDQDLKRACETLAAKVQGLIAQLRDTVGMRALEKREAFRFIYGLLNYAPHKTELGRLSYDSYIDFQACDSTLDCFPDHLRLDSYSIEVLSLRELPAQSRAYQLKALVEIPSNYIIAMEWQRESNFKMIRRLHSMRKHFNNKKSSPMAYVGTNEPLPGDVLVNTADVAIVEQLGQCLKELEVNRNYFGQLSLTVVVYDEDRARLKRSVAEFMKVFGTQEARLTEETYNLLNAWLSVLPGNHAYNLRRSWALSTNHADWSFLFAVREGDRVNAHLNREHLAILETHHKTPYFLNLHVGDVAHTMIVAPTGKGKTFLLKFLIEHAQKYKPRTTIFDFRSSYGDVTRQFGGTYVPIGTARKGFAINPFTLSKTEENVQFLFSFVKLLAQVSRYELTGSDEKDLYEQIDNLYEIDPALRRLYTLSNMLGRPLRQALGRWVEGGQYGTLFDNVTDNLTFAHFQTFDFGDVGPSSEFLEPLLFYILHRANASIYDPALHGTFKIFVLEEAWRFLLNPTINQYVQGALKTWRKENAAMILATQSGDDLVRSKMLSVVVESCPTKIFLANPDMNPEVYREAFHLNDTEMDWIARRLAPKHQLLLKQPAAAKVLNLSVDAKAFARYTGGGVSVESIAREDDHQSHQTLVAKESEL
jgi:type IV secretion system protein TrbE